MMVNNSDIRGFNSYSSPTVVSEFDLEVYKRYNDKTLSTG